MQKAIIKTKVLTEREYKKLHWTLREAKKFELFEAAKVALRDIPRPDQGFDSVTIEVGSGAYPENCHLAPVFSLLRNSGWIIPEAVITLKKSDFRGIIIIF